jgi:hypothetical protein
LQQLERCGARRDLACLDPKPTDRGRPIAAASNAARKEVGHHEICLDMTTRSRGFEEGASANRILIRKRSAPMEMRKHEKRLRITSRGESAHFFGSGLVVGVDLVKRALETFDGHDQLIAISH